MTAVIYARYSSDNQREESIEGQIRECTAYAGNKGLDRRRDQQGQRSLERTAAHRRPFQHPLGPGHPCCITAQ